MSLAALLALAVVGIGVGFLAGLVGIGGGVLIVPFLYFFYSHEAWSGIALAPTLQATVAHATSLFIIVPTAVVGTATYARAGLVLWQAVVPIAGFSILAAATGALIAARVPAEVLKVGFGSFLLFTAVQLISRRASRHPGPVRVNLPIAAVTGLLVGVFSALLGVGGGLVAIPLLLHVMRLEMERVAATSLAIVAVAATAGTLTYAASGVGTEGMPPGHIGFVHVAAALPMLPGAMLAARWGARLNQRMDARVLRWTFAALLAALGLRLAIANVSQLLG